MKGSMPWRTAAVLLVVAAAVLVFALPAQAHNPVHWKKLTPGTSSSVRSTSYDHGSFKIEMIAYFGRVRRTTAYLDHVTFKTCPDISIVGWLMFAYNSNASYRYNADTGRTYYRCGSFTQQVDRTFTGGYSNGNVAITVEKRNVDPYCSMVACDAHKSYAVFYVPPT